MLNQHRWRGVVCAAITGLLAFALAACGSSGSGSGSTGTSTIPLKAGESPVGQQLDGKRRGGVLTVYEEADFENLDPGGTYSDQDYTVMSATQRPLYSYPPNTATKLEPDVAAGPPIVSDGGKTVTVHLKRHIYFSPPVNREVNSGDVAYAIDRGANPNVANPYFMPYFGDLVGAEKATGGPIPGIETPNGETIVFHLTKPTAAILTGALSLPLSAPVPPEFAKPLDAHHPTTYGTEYLVATGPYMLKSDSSGKFLGIGYQPGKSATLVRNPRWNPHTDYRPAYLDQININIGGEKDVIGQQVLKGEDELENDPPAQSIVKEAYEHYPQQITFTPGSGTYYSSLNNAHGPFTNVDLRRAVWAALDRDALVKVRGGPLVAAPMTHFLYPGVAGFEEAGGLAGPKLDYNEHPEGDPAVAEKYMRLAGYPSGKYTGGKTLQVVGVTGEPESGTAQIVNQTLLNLGFKTHLSLVDKSVMYEKSLRRALAGDRRLPQRRLDARLRRSADRAVRAVLRTRDLPLRQRQLGPGQQPPDQRRDGTGGAGRRRTGARAGVGEGRRKAGGPGGRRPRGVRQPGQHRGPGRRRCRCVVEQRLVGLRLHLAEVS